MKFLEAGNLFLGVITLGLSSPITFPAATHFG